MFLLSFTHSNCVLGQIKISGNFRKFRGGLRIPEISRNVFFSSKYSKWGVVGSVLSSPSRVLRVFFHFDPTWSPGTPLKGPPDLGKPTFFKLNESWHVGCPQKRLLEPVKNFEKKIIFDLTQPPGTPPKGPPRPPKTDFFQTKRKLACGVSPEASAQAHQEF